MSYQFLNSKKSPIASDHIQQINTYLEDNKIAVKQGDGELSSRHPFFILILQHYKNKLGSNQISAVSPTDNIALLKTSICEAFDFFLCNEKQIQISKPVLGEIKGWLDVASRKGTKTFTVKVETKDKSDPTVKYLSDTSNNVFSQAFVEALTDFKTVCLDSVVTNVAASNVNSSVVLPQPQPNLPSSQQQQQTSNNNNNNNSQSQSNINTNDPNKIVKNVTVPLQPTSVTSSPAPTSNPSNQPPSIAQSSVSHTQLGTTSQAQSNPSPAPQLTPQKTPSANFGSGGPSTNTNNIAPAPSFSFGFGSTPQLNVNNNNNNNVQQTPPQATVNPQPQQQQQQITSPQPQPTTPVPPQPFNVNFSDLNTQNRVNSWFQKNNIGFADVKYITNQDIEFTYQKNLTIKIKFNNDKYDLTCLTHRGSDKIETAKLISDVAPLMQDLILECYRNQPGQQTTNEPRPQLNSKVNTLDPNVAAHLINLKPSSFLPLSIQNNQTSQAAQQLASSTTTSATVLQPVSKPQSAQTTLTTSAQAPQPAPSTPTSNAAPAKQTPTPPPKPAQAQTPAPVTSAVQQQQPQNTSTAAKQSVASGPQLQPTQATSTTSAQAPTQQAINTLAQDIINNAAERMIELGNVLVLRQSNPHQVKKSLVVIMSEYQEDIEETRNKISEYKKAITTSTTTGMDKNIKTIEDALNILAQSQKGLTEVHKQAAALAKINNVVDNNIVLNAEQKLVSVDILPAIAAIANVLKTLLQPIDFNSNNSKQKMEQTQGVSNFLFNYSRSQNAPSATVAAKQSAAPTSTPQSAQAASLTPTSSTTSIPASKQTQVPVQATTNVTVESSVQKIINDAVDIISVGNNLLRINTKSVKAADIYKTYVDNVACIATKVESSYEEYEKACNNEKNKPAAHLEISMLHQSFSWFNEDIIPNTGLPMDADQVWKALLGKINSMVVNLKDISFGNAKIDDKTSKEATDFIAKCKPILVPTSVQTTGVSQQAQQTTSPSSATPTSSSTSVAQHSQNEKEIKKLVGAFIKYAEVMINVGKYFLENNVTSIKEDVYNVKPADGSSPSLSDMHSQLESDLEAYQNINGNDPSIEKLTSELNSVLTLMSGSDWKDIKAEKDKCLEYISKIAKVLTEAPFTVDKLETRNKAKKFLDRHQKYIQPTPTVNNNNAQGVSQSQQPSKTMSTSNPPLFGTNPFTMLAQSSNKMPNIETISDKIIAHAVDVVTVGTILFSLPPADKQNYVHASNSFLNNTYKNFEKDVSAHNTMKGKNQVVEDLASNMKSIHTALSNKTQNPQQDCIEHFRNIAKFLEANTDNKDVARKQAVSFLDLLDKYEQSTLTTNNNNNAPKN